MNLKEKYDLLMERMADKKLSLGCMIGNLSRPKTNKFYESEFIKREK